MLHGLVTLISVLLRLRAAEFPLLPDHEDLTFSARYPLQALYTRFMQIACSPTRVSR